MGANRPGEVEHGPVLVFDLGMTHVVGGTSSIFGVEIPQVLHVFEPELLSLVPLAPEVVLGIVSYHGRIVTVIDPSVLLDSVAAAGEGPETRVILLRQGKLSVGNIGLHVARVREIVAPSDLMATDVPPGRCVSWVAQHGQRLINILQVGQLLQSLARQFGSAHFVEPHQGVG